MPSRSGPHLALNTGMQVTGPMARAGRGGAGRAPALARSVEKASASSQLGARAQDDAKNRDRKTPRLQVELVCQDDTRGFDPLWDGPRLRPAFVAQLMGQVMPAHTARSSVQRAYGTAAPRIARLVDRRD